jgi:hypothetical protein
LCDAEIGQRKRFVRHHVVGSHQRDLNLRDRWRRETPAEKCEQLPNAEGTGSKSRRRWSVVDWGGSGKDKDDTTGAKITFR